MNKVFLKENGRLIHNREDVKEDPLVFLGSRVDLDERFTLRSYFRMFEAYPIFIQLGPFIQDCMAQYTKTATTQCTYGEIDHIELCKTIEMIGFPGEPRIEQYTSLLGVINSDIMDIKFLGLDHLLDMRLELGKLKHVVFGDKCDIFNFDTIFTLFEFIEGISWELSFHNKPKQCRIST